MAEWLWRQVKVLVSPEARVRIPLRSAFLCRGFPFFFLRGDLYSGLCPFFSRGSAGAPYICDRPLSAIAHISVMPGPDAADPRCWRAFGDLCLAYQGRAGACRLKTVRVIHTKSRGSAVGLIGLRTRGLRGRVSTVYTACDFCVLSQAGLIAGGWGFRDTLMQHV